MFTSTSSCFSSATFSLFFSGTSSSTRVVCAYVKNMFLSAKRPSSENSRFAGGIRKCLGKALSRLSLQAKFTSPYYGVMDSSLMGHRSVHCSRIMTRGSGCFSLLSKFCTGGVRTVSSVACVTAMGENSLAEEQSCPIICSEF